MHDTRITMRARTLVLALMFSVALPACESTSNWLRGRKTADAEPVILGAPETNQYVSELYELVSGDPATQAEIFADAKAQAQLTPNPTTKLRYALVLAAPGHAETNALEAQSLFRQLLSQTELLAPAEISLATIQLQEVEARLVLDAEVRRLRSENDRVATTENAAIAQRIATVEADNRQLRQSLEEAESKLEAITNIERSVREQNDGG